MLTFEKDTNKKTNIECQLQAPPAGDSSFLNRDMGIGRGPVTDH